MANNNPKQPQAGIFGGVATPGATQDITGLLSPYGSGGSIKKALANMDNFVPNQSNYSSSNKASPANAPAATKYYDRPGQEYAYWTRLLKQSTAKTKPKIAPFKSPSLISLGLIQMLILSQKTASSSSNILTLKNQAPSMATKSKIATNNGVAIVAAIILGVTRY